MESSAIADLETPSRDRSDLLATWSYTTQIPKWQLCATDYDTADR